MRPILGITNSDIPALLDLLRGDTDIKSPRTLTPEARKELEKVTDAIQKRQAHRFVESLLFELAVLGEKVQFHGLIFQWDSSQETINHRVDVSTIQGFKDDSHRSGDCSTDHHKSKDKVADSGRKGILNHPFTTEKRLF